MAGLEKWVFLTLAVVLGALILRVTVRDDQERPVADFLVVTFLSGVLALDILLVMGEL